ncbi:MAG: pyridoxamine 5'-phosphate oxidase family protein [Acidimicrobiales bacterium]
MTDTFTSNRLDCPEALGLVAACGYGRLVGTLHALPPAWPVAYRMEGDVIFFPRPEGFEVSSRLGRAVVGLEVDNGSMGHGADWSVMVVGEVVDCATEAQPREATTGAGTTADVALHPGVVIGRRLRG